MSDNWTRNDWQQHQRKIILAEYMEHLALQKREWEVKRNGRGKTTEARREYSTRSKMA